MLGPLEVDDGSGQTIPIRQPRQRSILASLLLRRERVVSAGTLITRLWVDTSALQARRSLHTAVSRLRQALGDTDGSLVRTQAPGYRLDVPADRTDAGRFDDLVERAAQAAGDPAARADLLTQALGLWRGRPYADVDTNGFGNEELVRLTERRDQALEWRIEADLALGNHAALIPELRQLTSRFPARERLWAHLMLALYRVGRQAEALEAYQSARRHLAETLGIQPGGQLRQLERDILNHADRLAAGSAMVAAGPHGPADHPWRLQRQLPLRDPLFTGREGLLNQISERLTSADTVPVVVLQGGPGVGKSALALQAAHALAARFPDGQWYVRLPAAVVAGRDPAEILAELLSSSGMPSSSIPDGLEARAAAWRSRIADRRVLLLLDDAANVDQVECLLPGTPGSAVLVTSRAELRSLAVTHGATLLPLDVLTATEARTLLHSALGRPTADPALDELATLCGMLPLALRIAAAQLIGPPALDPAQLVADLRDGDLLGALSIGADRRVAVRAAFDHSYQALPEQDALLFRRLGLIPAPPVSPEAAAALLDSDLAAASAGLERLASASLLQRTAPGRYRGHDLLLRYAAELAQSDGPDANQAARTRWFDYLLAYTQAADATIMANAMPKDPLFPSAAAARRWLDVERPAIVAAARMARQGPAAQLPFAWQLAGAATSYLNANRYSAEWRSVVTNGLRAAQLADRVGVQGDMEALLSVLEIGAGQYDRALVHYRRSLELRGEDHDICPQPLMLFFDKGPLSDAATVLRGAIAAATAADDTLEKAQTQAHLGAVLLDQGQLKAAVAAFTGAEAARRSATRGRHGASSHELTLHAVCLMLLGRPTEGEARLTTAYELSVRRGDRLAEAYALLTSAEFGAARGDLEQALADAKTAVAIGENIGYQPYIDALCVLGRTQQFLGDLSAAIGTLGRAWTLADNEGQRRAGLQARTRLAVALVANGQLDTAAAHLSATLSACRDYGYGVLEGLAMIALAQLRFAQGDVPEARRQARIATELFRSLDCVAGVAAVARDARF